MIKPILKKSVRLPLSVFLNVQKQSSSIINTNKLLVLLENSVTKKKKSYFHRGFKKKKKRYSGNIFNKTIKFPQNFSSFRVKVGERRRRVKLKGNQPIRMLTGRAPGDGRRSSSLMSLLLLIREHRSHYRSNQ